MKPNDALHKPVQEKSGLSDEQWAGIVKENFQL